MDVEKRMCENPFHQMNHANKPAMWIATNPGLIAFYVCEECRKELQEVNSETSWIPMFERLGKWSPKGHQKPTIQCDFVIERDVFGSGKEMQVQCPDEAQWRDTNSAMAFCAFHKTKWHGQDPTSTFTKL
jgi:hypothetical protein